jgi:membrane protein
MASSLSHRHVSISSLLGYAALAAIAYGWHLESDRGIEHCTATGKRPATGAFGTTRSTDEPRQLQYQRAQECGRGRRALAPWQIPRRGWKDILWRTYQQLNEDRLLAVAAGVVFYGLLALFPAITAIVSLYGLFATPSAIGEHLSLLAGFLPGGAIDIVQEQVTRLASSSVSVWPFGAPMPA